MEVSLLQLVIAITNGLRMRGQQMPRFGKDDTEGRPEYLQVGRM